MHNEMILNLVKNEEIENLDVSLSELSSIIHFFSYSVLVEKFLKSEEDFLNYIKKM